MSTEASSNLPQLPPEPEWLALVRDKVRDLRYGVVQLVVHDGRVTQIERTEKTRIAAEREEHPAGRPQGDSETVSHPSHRAIRRIPQRNSNLPDTQQSR
jgi:hypothetical protein